MIHFVQLRQQEKQQHLDCDFILTILWFFWTETFLHATWLCNAFFTLLNVYTLLLCRALLDAETAKEIHKIHIIPRDALDASKVIWKNSRNLLTSYMSRNVRNLNHTAVSPFSIYSNQRILWFMCAHQWHSCLFKVSDSIHSKRLFNLCSEFQYDLVNSWSNSIPIIVIVEMTSLTI